MSVMRRNIVLMKTLISFCFLCQNGAKEKKQGGEITLDVFQIPVIYYLPCFVVGCLKARHMIIMIFVNDLYMYFMKCT